jgi:hypothetical protein
LQQERFMEKVLWVVKYNRFEDFLRRAVDVGATAVAIRTDNDIAAVMPKFHANDLKVYGWRWPSATQSVAMREADHACDLLRQGMDGYYVDPEGEQGASYDWDQPGLEGVAEAFCKKITDAAPGKPFGVTSHYKGSATFPHIPWRSFFKYATVLLPQAYWRVTGGVVGHGKPKENYDKSIQAWVATGGDKAKIVPMAGELAQVTAAEIGQYAEAAAAANISELHFYTHEPAVKEAVWQAIAQISGSPSVVAAPRARSWTRSLAARLLGRHAATPTS